MLVPYKKYSAYIRSVTMEYGPCILIFFAFFGFISKSLYNVPIALMAILGLYHIYQTPKLLIQDRTLQIFSLVFLCLWLPQLLSLPDAVNLERSINKTLTYLRFFFAAIFIIHTITKHPKYRDIVATGLFYMVCFWCFDALIQFVFTKNLLGFPMIDGRPVGMFYPQQTFPIICTILLGFAFWYIYKNRQKWLLLSLIPLLVFTIFLPGQRSAWIMLLLLILGFTIYFYSYSADKKRLMKILSISFIVSTIVISLATIYHSPTKERIELTLGLFSGDKTIADNASSGRLSLWDTSYKIFTANPLNGVGVRGFRYAHSDYISSENYWFDQTPNYSHLTILEILVETGILGLLGLLLALFLIICTLWHSENKEHILPLFIMAMVALFPFNTHMAFYGSYWASMIWLLLSLYFAQVKLCQRHNKANG